MSKNRTLITRGKQSRQYLFIFLVVVSFFAIGIATGWIAHSTFAGQPLGVQQELKSLRLNGYKFISPLLTCDTVNDNSSQQLEALQNKVERLIDEEKTKKDIDVASVYIRDFNRGESMGVNLEEKYFPASLGKVPIAIAIYKMAESAPDILNKKELWSDATDYNKPQEIKPANALQPGTSYTVSEALEKMIKYSDNNSYVFLSKYVSPEIFKSTYSDLRIPLPENQQEPVDYMSAKDFSYFLRVLYNSTYLRKDYSEKVLELLSQSDFKEGLAKKIPESVPVAHKYGLKSVADSSGNYVSHELHDCGITYSGQNPYLLCVMTKSTSSLSDTEKSIANISELVFNNMK